MSDDKDITTNSDDMIHAGSDQLMPAEDELEKLLDSESDSDFGEAQIAEHLDADDQPLILRDWTGKDFADIYVRFYPHVLRQAKRYLTNHAQAEEVTQDAFLYLMTSLPEVDSDIGVLKLLKWKTRLLALGVISANGEAKFAPIDDQLELSIDDSELGKQLERADDAAIVALALAKLEPRQREALLASLYEEKATSAVASQLGLNENATKQLIYRAKASFRKALIGEAETAGLSVSQILSLATRKAARESGKQVAAVGAFLLALAVTIGALPGLVAQDEITISSGQLAESSEQTGSAPVQPQESPEPSIGDASTPNNEVVTPEAETFEIVQTVQTADQKSTTVESGESSATATENVSLPTLNTESVALLSSLSVSARNSGFAYAPNTEATGYQKRLLIFTGSTTASFILSGDSSQGYLISELAVTLPFESGPVILKPSNYASASSRGDLQTSVTFVANGLTAKDADGNDYTAALSENATITVSIEVDRLGQPMGANFFITN